MFRPKSFLLHELFEVEALEAGNFATGQFQIAYPAAVTCKP